MQIHFIWVNHFKSLSGKAINLSDRFIFKWDDTNVKGRFAAKLTITNNQTFIPNFFGKENVEGVSAIIGKNGAGKSTVIDYIRTHLPEGLEAKVERDIIAYSRFEQGEEKFYLVLPYDSGITIIDETGNFQKLNYGDDSMSNEFRWLGQLSRAEYIYYSYFLDHNRKHENCKGLRDISTSSLLQGERIRIMEETKGGQLQLHLLTQSSDLDNFAKTEMAKTIQFLNSSFGKKLPFKTPEELFITIDLNDRLHFTVENSRHQDAEKILKSLDGLPKQDLVLDRFMDQLALGVFVNFLIDERKYTIRNPYIHKIIFTEGDTILSFVDRYFRSMSNVTFDYDGHKVAVSKLQELSITVPKFLALFKEALQDKTILPYRESASTIILPLNANTRELFESLCSSYLAVKGISSFLDFSWRSLSSGEQSFLTFMARFYHIRFHEHNELKKELIILIDEGDAGYHPEWQRQFFKITLDFLSKLFSGYQLQLIFAANTPFLTSDLPKANVLFIEQTEDKTSFFHSKENDRVETFGANIHQLYSDSFYMEGVMIGAFAKAKIDQIIRYLGDKKNVEPKEEYKHTIALIGEPVIKRKLEQMWLQKFGMAEELKMLEQRMAKIKSAISKKKNK